MLTYEILIKELQERVPHVKFFVYIEDIAVVTRTTQHMHETIDTIQAILPAVGMQMSAKKTQIYQCISQVVQHDIQGIPV